MSHYRTKEISLIVLECLDDSDGYAVPEPTLRTMLDVRMRPPVGDAEFEIAMVSLHAKDAIATVPDEFDQALVKHVIKERGKALLAAQ